MSISMQADDLLQRARDKMARDQRMTVARAAIGACNPDEQEELLLEMLGRQMEASEASKRAGSLAPAVPAHSHDGRVTEEPLRVGDAIIEVMRDGVARATGDICRAVVARYPKVNVRSIPAAVARIVGATEHPRLIKRGKNERGDALYAIAGPIGENAARAEVDGEDDDDDDDDGAVNVDESGASRILAVFQRQSGMRVTLQSVIAELPDLDPNLIRTAAARFARTGKLKKMKRGVYRHIGTDE